MKKIIFGAGNYGRHAIEHFGEENVYCFVDNNTKKRGSLYCGKEIIDFPTFLEIEKNYETVIATRFYSSIADQLRKNGIKKFDFFMPEFEKAKSVLVEQIKDTEGDLVLFGVDDCIELITNIIEKYKKAGFLVRLADKNNSPLIGEKAYGLTVEPLDSIKYESSIVIVSCPNRAFALDVYAKRVLGNNARIINPFIQQEYYPTDRIVFSAYDENGSEWTENEWIDSVSNNPSLEAMNEYVDELEISQPLFEHVEIETINRCNGICDFCPVNAHSDIREKKVMEESLFKKIIDELSEIDYSGRIATFSNNEPFLDSRIIEFNKYAREKLPNARIHLFTNGTLLSIDKFISIIDYLDELIIDNYDQELKLIKNSEQIKKYCEDNPELQKKVTIVIRRPHEILTSRGGDAPNRVEKKSYPNIKCSLPYKQLIIRPDGKVSLCCNDPYGKYTMGDVSKDKIIDVWKGQAFTDIRNRLKKGRGNVDHCVYCDTFILF